MTDEQMTEAELPLEGVGARLARAREAAGISRVELSGITKIPERHLVLIEAGDFAALPARTYAVGFSRSYARAVGLDEAAIAAEVRAELAAIEPEVRRSLPAFEPGDPARIPSARFAWVAALIAVIVILAGFAFWRSYYLPGGTLPSLIDEPPPVSVSSDAPIVNVDRTTTLSGGAVVFTALEPGVWVKFYDAAGAQLMQKELALGETYTIPADVSGVQMWTARPQALAITIGGQAVPKLSEVQVTMKDVPVSAAALLARPLPGAIATPTPEPASTSSVRTAPQRSTARPQRAAPPSAPVQLVPGPAPITAASVAAVPVADR